MPRISAPRISTTYALRRFPHSNDADFKSAVGIYVANITPDSRTNSNEIAYWIDRYSKEFSDEFCVCGFYLDGKIIGFTEFVYFQKERLIIFDYLVLHKNYRTHGEYYQFVKMLQNWIDEQGFEFDFTVAEVSYESDGPTPSERSFKLVELFKQIGFLVADCYYRQPLLGLDNPQSDMRAHLLLAARERIYSVKRETLLRIVHTVYFKHYERWYTPLFDKVDDVEKYHEMLTSRFQAFEKRLEKTEIELDGIKTSQPLILPAPAPKEQVRRKLAPAFLAASFVWFLCLGLILLQHYFNLSTESLIATLGASLIVFVAVFALFNNRGQRVLEKLLDFTTKFFGRTK